jgi:hypothetical protein
LPDLDFAENATLVPSAEKVADPTPPGQKSPYNFQDLLRIEYNAITDLRFGVSAIGHTTRLFLQFSSPVTSGNATPQATLSALGDSAGSGEVPWPIKPGGLWTSNFCFPTAKATSLSGLPNNKVEFGSVNMFGT